MVIAILSFNWDGIASRPLLFHARTQIPVWRFPECCRMFDHRIDAGPQWTIRICQIPESLARTALAKVENAEPTLTAPLKMGQDEAADH